MKLICNKHEKKNKEESKLFLSLTRNHVWGELHEFLPQNDKS